MFLSSSMTSSMFRPAAVVNAATVAGIFSTIFRRSFSELLSVSLIEDGLTVQLRDADAGLCTVGCKLNGGLDVTASLASTIMPGPMSLDELRRWAVAKW